MSNSDGGILVVIGAIFTLGLSCGGFFSEFLYAKDTYDCTVKCPNNSHSIQHDNICYCEVK